MSNFKYDHNTDPEVLNKIANQNHSSPRSLSIADSVKNCKLTWERIQQNQREMQRRDADIQFNKLYNEIMKF